VHVCQRKQSGRLDHSSNVFMVISAVNTIISQQMQQCKAEQIQNEIHCILKRDLRQLNLCDALCQTFIFISRVTKWKHACNLKFIIRIKQLTNLFSLGEIGYIDQLIP